MRLQIYESDFAMNSCEKGGHFEPLVSVIINCFNGSLYLRFAIESVLKQVYVNWELIVWDNQSTDNSADISKSYSDSRIKYLYAPRHTTLGEARNCAVAHAKGTWISFLDCDDIILDNKLQEQVRRIGFDIGLVYCRTLFKIENMNHSNQMERTALKNKVYPSYKSLPSGKIVNRLLFDCFISLPSAIISKKYFIQCGGIDSSLRVAEDYDIFIKIASISNVVSIDKILCVYRVHDNNMSNYNIDLTFKESVKIISRYKLNLFMPFALMKWVLQHFKRKIMHWNSNFFQ